MPGTDSGGPRSNILYRLHRHWALVMVLLSLLYLAQSLYYATVLMPNTLLVEYLVVGVLAITGEVSVFDDRLPGIRAPLPYYVLGFSQWLLGRNLLAARWLNVGFGLLTLLVTAALARRLAGATADFLTALFFVTQGVVVAYYTEGWFAFAAFCFVGGLMVFLGGGDSARRRVLGVALIGLLFFVRSNFWPAIPFLLSWAIWRARGLVERALLLGVVVLPPLIFFAWDPRHLKILAYVPVLRHLVASLGYVSAFVLDDRPVESLAIQLWEVARLVRRYEFWVLAIVVLLALVLWRWATGRSVRGLPENQKANFLTVLFVYMLIYHFLMFPWNWKWVGLYFLAFAPLVPLLLGIGYGYVLADTPPRSWSRRLLGLGLGLLLLPPLYFVRNPLLPIGEVMAGDPFAAVHRAAAHLRRVVPQNAKVFFYGYSLIYYLSGLPPTYLTQAHSDEHLAAIPVDDDILRKSGFVPLNDMARWLSAEADFAVIDPTSVELHKDRVPVAIATMKALLDKHFDKIDTVNEYPFRTHDVYKRKTGG